MKFHVKLTNAIRQDRGVHAPCEADTFALSGGVAQNAGRDDLSVLSEQCLHIVLFEVKRQIGDIEIGRILLLLLRREQKYFATRLYDKTDTMNKYLYINICISTFFFPDRYEC